ncbi:Gfo/Idh/MocA family protein [Microlunatus flavus]|uniref:Predicted dehydrogenase n=1 Tax=Microlunatus flavus TaxID=1036181 RepID=A0A1H9A682_9ACTN|nr:Gfo/Idh/MocA family oxidoreductase [Microlunatus flavus]SEP72246.1 Predicted dehydrogenase [Microlunatus flavus]
MPSTRTPLAVGMVGLNVRGNGWAAEGHAPAVQAVDGLVLAGVATTRPETAAEAAARFGVARSYGDPLAMIDDPAIDVVAVVSPVPTHRELVLAALDRGKPVLTEWPVAAGGEAMAEIAAIEARAAVPHAVNLQARRSPAAVRLADLVADGALGRTLSVRVLSTTAGFGSSIVPAYVPLEEPATWTSLGTIQTAHTLDLVTHVFGALGDAHALLDVQHPVVEVEGREPVVRHLPDHVLVHGRLAGGGTLDLEVQGGRAPDDAPFRLEVVGERASAALLGGAPRGFQAGTLRLLLDGAPVDLPPSALDALPASVVNVAHTYAALRDDIEAGTRTAPSFGDAADLAASLASLGLGLVEG